MNTYNRKEINRILNSDLLIYWWNFNKKTLDFEGTIKEYLKKENIKLQFKCYKDEHLDIELYNIKVHFNCGDLNNIRFTCKNIENAIKMCINIRQSYLGDKSKYILLGKTRTINF